MLYEVLMTGYPPWGFRISGGIEFGQPTFISRLTPGGKAHQSNVQIGDILLAVNGRKVHDMRLRKIMKIVKANCDHLHLTLERKAGESQVAMERSLNTEKIGLINFSSNIVTTDFVQNNSLKETFNRVPPIPKARSRKISEAQSEPPQVNYKSELNIAGLMEKEMEIDMDELSNCDAHSLQDHEEVNFKPQVHWLHGKLRLMRSKSGDNTMNEGMKSAILSRSGESIELEGGEVILRHRQYNTPARLYSEDQMLNVVFDQAKAERRRDAKNLRKIPIKVDRKSSVYKLVHNISPKKSSPSQSPSINLLKKLHQQQDEYTSTKLQKN